MMAGLLYCLVRSHGAYNPAIAMPVIQTSQHLIHSLAQPASQSLLIQSPSEQAIIIASLNLEQCI